MTNPLDLLVSKRLSSNGESLPDDDGSKRDLPILWSFLTRRDAGGSFSKEPASISIRLGLGQWLVVLTDPSLEVSLSASSPSLALCLEHLEDAARNPTAAWCPWKRSKGKFEKVNTKPSSHVIADA